MVPPAGRGGTRVAAAAGRHRAAVRGTGETAGEIRSITTSSAPARSSTKAAADFSLIVEMFGIQRAHGAEGEDAEDDRDDRGAGHNAGARRDRGDREREAGGGGIQVAGAEQVGAAEAEQDELSDRSRQRKRRGERNPARNRRQPVRRPAQSRRRPSP